MKNKTEQMSFEHIEADNGPVVCLGMTFENEEARREYFRDELRKKLPELKKIEGFPIGEDADIIALSDPPYYTACPNPWVNDFIENWEAIKKEISGEEFNDNYHREPFAVDVSEGKADPIYNAHSYHTKVPYKAIMRYILHYTNPGDIVLDLFSGTGMTGVAASMCSNREVVQSMGFRVEKNRVLDQNGNLISLLGKRDSILNDLSTSASFIAHNYNSKVNIEEFKKQITTIIEKVEDRYKWVYETYHMHDNENKKGYINYVIWSDVFYCPNCSDELIFYNIALNDEKNKVKDKFSCPKCNSILTKDKLERVKVASFDDNLQETIEQTKQVPVGIYYIYKKKRYFKSIDKEDKNLLSKIDALTNSSWYPKNSLPNGKNTQQPKSSHGFTHVSHFYTKRNLFILSRLYEEIQQHMNEKNLGLLVFQSIVGTLTSKLVRYNLGNRGNGILNGTLYVSSLNAESNVFNVLKGKVNDFYKAFNSLTERNIVTVQSATQVGLKENSIDYIFTDPPFGANINYSELNFIWESWLKILTNNQSEAIINSIQGKDLIDYQELMEESFKNYYRVLKPGRWMTVEFSNSKASVWNSIQEAIQKAGFVIANVSALDKKQGSFKAVTSTTAVKQDLVISAYKPTQENVEKMKKEQNTEESAWTFIKQHLENLPVFIGVKGEAQVISERTPRILFDRMIAFHVQNGFSVPISSAEFQSGIAQRFPMRDGMVFLDKQVAEYDKKRTLFKEFGQLSLFVSDENSAIEWIRQQLLKKPQTRQDIHPNYMREIQHIAKHELLPELDDLLNQNFLRYDGDGKVPDQIASYLRKNYKDLRGLEAADSVLIDRAMNRWYVPDPNKQADLEKLREKSLLREFQSYLDELESSKKKLKQFRTEAIRAGFKKAYSEKDFEKIVKVGDRLPESVIQEDDKLLMYYDNACIRLGL